MTEKFLNSFKRDKALYNELFKYLDGFSNDEKCEITVAIAERLMEMGGKDNYFAAELILINATQKYMQVSDTNYKAIVYYALGNLYENHLEHFIKAYTYYEKYTLNNTINEGSSSILLRALILRDNFTYSEELENHYLQSLGEYDLGYRNDRIYETLGAFIIAKHKGDSEKEELLTKKLKAILKGDEFFFLDFVLTKEKTPVRLQVPKKVIEYIKAL
ncbi:MAG: hypothetical protein IIX14_00855 [Clostridia bacterium]|nr:hypothetical protein [Clostridia bacterium]